MDRTSQLTTQVKDLENRIAELQALDEDNHRLRIHALEAILKQKMHSLKHLQSPTTTQTSY